MPRKSKAAASSAPASKKATPVETPKVEVAAAAVVEAPAVTPATTVAVVAAGPTLNDEFSQVLTQLSALRTQMNQLNSNVRALQKRCDRELRVAQKAGKKKQRKVGNRAPSGFVKPTKISLELATFLGKPKGTEMARTQVTREINQYIRANNLQDPENGRRILPDAKLRKLLNVGKADVLTYFNLQRYMSPHFAKSVKAIAAQEQAAESL